MTRMVQCKACKTEISSGAKACPRCGHRKKGFFDGCGILLVVALLILIVIWLFGAAFFGALSA